MKNKKSLSNKVVVITGAARGIGLGIAKKLGNEGAKIYICDIDKDAGQKAKKLLKSLAMNVEYMYVDLSQPNSGADLLSSIFKSSDKIDILINNAKAGNRCEILEETEENWDKTMDVGLKASFFISQALIKFMADKGGCNIVNIASIAGTQVTLESPSYHASKAALIQTTKYLAVMGGVYKARVNSILPGFIVQEEHKKYYESKNNESYRNLSMNYQPLGKVGTEEDIANAVCFLVKDESSYISGQCLILDGGATIQEPWGLLYQYSQKS